jgi:SOS-response transcriptional repressor LexA
MHPDTIKLMKEICAYIKEYQVEFETSPSAEDIAKKFGKHTNTIYGLFEKMADRGMIFRESGARRAIEVLI